MLILSGFFCNFAPQKRLTIEKNEKNHCNNSIQHDGCLQWGADCGLTGITGVSCNRNKKCNRRTPSADDGERDRTPTADRTAPDERVANGDAAGARLLCHLAVDDGLWCVNGCRWRYQSAWYLGRCRSAARSH